MNGLRRSRVFTSDGKHIFFEPPVTFASPAHPVKVSSGPRDWDIVRGILKEG